MEKIMINKDILLNTLNNHIAYFENEAKTTNTANNCVFLEGKVAGLKHVYRIIQMEIFNEK